MCVRFFSGLVLLSGCLLYTRLHNEHRCCRCERVILIPVLSQGNLKASTAPSTLLAGFLLFFFFERVNTLLITSFHHELKPADHDFNSQTHPAGISNTAPQRATFVAFAFILCMPACNKITGAMKLYLIAEKQQKSFG